MGVKHFCSSLVQKLQLPSDWAHKRVPMLGKFFLKGLNNRSLDGHNVGAYMPFRPSVGNRDIRRHQMVYLIVRTLTHIKYLFSILLFFGQNAVYPGADITFLLIFLPEFSLGILFWLCSLV